MAGHGAWWPSIDGANARSRTQGGGGGGGGSGIGECEHAVRGGRGADTRVEAGGAMAGAR
jgi:hypothetical protein